MEDKTKKGEPLKKARKPQQCSKCDSYDHNASWHKSGGVRVAESPTEAGARFCHAPVPGPALGAA